MDPKDNYQVLIQHIYFVMYQLGGGGSKLTQVSL